MVYQLMWHTWWGQKGGACPHSFYFITQDDLDCARQNLDRDIYWMGVHAPFPPRFEQEDKTAGDGDSAEHAAESANDETEGDGEPQRRVVRIRSVVDARRTSAWSIIGMCSSRIP